MCSEWRSNMWLALELLIISVVLWYIADFMYCQLSVVNEPLGFEIDHCYQIEFSVLNEKSEDFMPDRTSNEARAEDLQTLLQRIDARPEIEAVGAGINAILYNGSNNGSILSYDSISTDSYVVQRSVTPDFARVFKIQGKNGESPEEIARALRENPRGFFAGGNIFPSSQIKDISQLIGKQFKHNGNGSSELTLIGELVPVRYSDYVPRSMSQSILMPLMVPYMMPYVNEIAVRVKDNMDKDFASALMKDAQGALRVGNFFVSGVRSFDDRKAAYNRAHDRELRNYVVGAVFLSFNVFLGLLGTFWFRTQQREREIAIRRVNGAATADIFRRTMSEGFLLLTLVTPFAVVLDYLLALNELNSYYEGFFSPARFAVSVIAVYVVISLMIVLGILFPALRAVKLKPAIVLADN